MTACLSGPPKRGLSIRSATADDVGHLVPMFDAYRQFYGQRADAGRARDFLAERLARSESHVLVALDGPDAAASPLGFAQLYPSFSSLQCRPTLVLNDLYVIPAGRGRGVGVALLDHARRLAVQLGACSIALQTATDNQTAQRLYERCGFVRDSQFVTYLLPLS